MSDKRNNLVIIAFDDLTEFYAVRPDIDMMLQRKVRVKLLVVRAYSEKMYEDTKNTIARFGYDVISANSKLKCKVLLEPYPLVTDVSAEFRIRYQYGVSPYSVKPYPVYIPEWNLPFDAEVCYSELSQDILSVYSKAFIIKPLQFIPFKPHEKGKKTNLLVLLAWGDIRATWKLAEIKEQLGEKYNVIIKIHHAVQYRPDHEGIAEKLKSIADEYHDATTNVNHLYERADIVLTDNSSAVFEAIYLGIPAAIFSEATSDYHSLNGIKAAHVSLLIEARRIPYTNKIKDVKRIIEQASEDINNQNQLKKELYPANARQTLTDVVEKYLGLSRKLEPYYIIRDLLIGKIKSDEAKIIEQTTVINNLSIEKDTLGEQLDSFLGVKRSARLLSGNIKRKIKSQLMGSSK